MSEFGASIVTKSIFERLQEIRDELEKKRKRIYELCDQIKQLALSSFGGDELVDVTEFFKVLDELRSELFALLSLVDKGEVALQVDSMVFSGDIYVEESNVHISTISALIQYIYEALEEYALSATKPIVGKVVIIKFETVILPLVIELSARVRAFTAAIVEFMLKQLNTLELDELRTNKVEALPSTKSSRRFSRGKQQSEGTEPVEAGGGL